jgi:hypothetical protein
MKAFLKYLFTGFKYLLLQGVAEIVMILALEYMGFQAMLDFSKSNLLIENIEGIAWAISMKTVIFSLLYLPLFIIISYWLTRNKMACTLSFSIVNALLSSLLLVTLLLLKHKDLGEMIVPMTATLFASFLIIIIVKIKFAIVKQEQIK